MGAPTEVTHPLSRQPGRRSAAELGEAIRGLDAPLRLVIALHHVEGLSLGEIAAVLGEPEEEIAARFYWVYVGIGACPSPDEAALCA